jgi:NADH dehydrogenase
MPVVLLAKPNAKFQPVWVEDVASCFVASIQNTETYSQVYELAGPKVYSFRELVQQVMTTLGIKRPIVGLCDKLSYAQAFMMELLPVKLMSRDNVRSMEVDSISQQPFPAIFGVVPASLEAVIPEYLVDSTQRGKYDRFRSFAAR